MTAFTCPHCKRELVNRKVARCLFCGRDLPADMLIPEDKKNLIEESAREAHQQHQRMMKWLGEHEPKSG